MFNINIYLLRVLVKEMYYGKIIVTDICLLLYVRKSKQPNWKHHQLVQDVDDQKTLQQEKIAEHHQHPSAEHQWCW